MSDVTTTDEVSTALRLLHESLDSEVSRINGEGAVAMKQGDYETAQAVIDFARKLQSFQGKVSGLSSEWDALEEESGLASEPVQQIVSKRFFGKARKGEITPHTAYFQPLLETLNELGGKAKTKVVLDRLGEKMKPFLKAKDYEVHSDGRSIRWRNAAQWARNTMVNEDGRMKKGSPRGIWEISEKGKRFLRSSKKDS
jgi:hypothetical protein